MICQKCKEQGLKSKVYSGGGSTTLMYCPPFYDEDGHYHCHDSNTTTAEYSCSNGHTWTEHHRGTCWCGWPIEKEEK